MGRAIAIFPITTGIFHDGGISLSGPDWMDKLHVNGIFPIFHDFQNNISIDIDKLDTTNSVTLTHVKKVFKELFDFDIGYWIHKTYPYPNMSYGIADDDMVIVACDH
jgi:hypothetical protein